MKIYEVIGVWENDVLGNYSKLLIKSEEDMEKAIAAGEAAISDDSRTTPPTKVYVVENDYGRVRVVWDSHLGKQASVMSELESIRNEIGEEKFADIERFLEAHPGLYLNDVYYDQGVWNETENWVAQNQGQAGYCPFCDTAEAVVNTKCGSCGSHWDNEDGYSADLIAASLGQLRMSHGYQVVARASDYKQAQVEDVIGTFKVNGYTVDFMTDGRNYSAYVTAEGYSDLFFDVVGRPTLLAAWEEAASWIGVNPNDVPEAMALVMRTTGKVAQSLKPFEQNTRWFQYKSYEVGVNNDGSWNVYAGGGELHLMSGQASYGDIYAAQVEAQQWIDRGNADATMQYMNREAAADDKPKKEEPELFDKDGNPVDKNGNPLETKHEVEPETSGDQTVPANDVPAEGLGGEEGVPTDSAEDVKAKPDGTEVGDGADGDGTEMEDFSMNIAKADKAEAAGWIRQNINPGVTVYFEDYDNVAYEGTVTRLVDDTDNFGIDFDPDFNNNINSSIWFNFHDIAYIELAEPINQKRKTKPLGGGNPAGDKGEPGKFGDPDHENPNQATDSFPEGDKPKAEDEGEGGEEKPEDDKLDKEEAPSKSDDEDEDEDDDKKPPFDKKSERR